MSHPSLHGASTQDAPAVPIPGVLIFIIADLVVFGMLFMGFMSERMNQLALFDQSSATLNVHLGLVNTLILMTSGMFVVFAVDAARRGNAALARRWLLVSMLVGAGFGATKLMEYQDKFAHGISIFTNDFYMFYFALTGAHFLHFLGGMILLAVLWFRVGREGLGGSMFRLVESGALYWHMVDLLWIVIFPMLYLLGAR